MPQNDGWEDVKISSSGNSGWEDVPQYQEQPSYLNRLMSYDVPLIDITPATNWMSQKYSEFSKPRQMSSFEQSVLRGFPGLAQIQEFIDPGKTGSTAPWTTLGSELIKGTGEVASGLTTPSNVIATAASGGAYGAAKAGLAPAIPKALTWAARAASVPTTIHGAQTIANAEDWQDVGMGFGELAGGLAGTFEPMPRMRPSGPEVKPFTDAVEAQATPSPEQPNLPGIEPPEPPGPRMPPSERGPDGLPNVVVKSNWSAGEIAFFKSKGFESGGVSPQGLPYMIRKGTEDPFTGGLINEPQLSADEAMEALRASVQREQPAVKREGSVPFNDEDGFTLPKESLTKAKVQALEEQGYGVVGYDDAGNTIFQRLLDDESGGLVTDPEHWVNALRGRTRREILPGEQRGRVAQFEQPEFPSDIPITTTHHYYDTPDSANLLRNEIKTYEEMLTNPELKPDGTRRYSDAVYQQDRQFLEQSKRELAALEARLGRNPENQPSVFDYTRPKSVFDKFEEPQEMRVEGVREGNTGLENVAMGGGSPRVLDVMSSSLYSKNRQVITTKELLQNAFDEHKITGTNEPVRVLFDGMTKTPDGKEGRSISIRDRGRGLMPEQIYTVLSNLGETGKAGVESASGGFGFAKAAPFLGGQFVKVRSVVDTPTGRKLFTFEGRPSDLKNQAKGVPLNEIAVDTSLPTGLEITTYFDRNASGYLDAIKWAGNMTQRSSNVGGGIKLVQDFSVPEASKRAFLDGTPNPNKYDLPLKETEFRSEAMPELQDTITVPGSEIDIRYDIDPNLETSDAAIHYSNKGMYQGSGEMSYGAEVKNVPSDIVADIRAIVDPGHDDYPFSLNREQINENVSKAIQKWVQENIISGVQRKRVQAVQRQYDNIRLLNEEQDLHNTHFLDEGNRLYEDELAEIADDIKLNQSLVALENVHNKILDIADSLGWKPWGWGNPGTWKRPSERLKKFGLLMKGPDEKGRVTMGIHIPRPDDPNNSAILINLFEHLNQARSKAPGAQVDTLVTDLFTTIAHEQAHIPGGQHDTDFAYRDAELRGKIGDINTTELFRELREAFDDGQGNISPELSKVLSIYNNSRGRAASSTNDVLATGVNSTRRQNLQGTESRNTGGSGSGGNQPPTPPKSGGAGGSGRGGRKRPEPSVLREAYNFSRGATTTADLSAPMRQGLPLITRKEWWKSWNQMRQALGSEEAYQKILSDLRARPIFQNRIDMATGKVTKSFAEQVGMTLSDLKELTGREEAVASNWIETGKFLGPLAPVYKGSFGRVARASNRAYTAFLNQLRADTFEALLKDAEGIYMKGEKGAKNPYTDLVFARQIADFVNTATGRGPLKVAIPTIEGGRVGLKEKSFEQNAKLLTDTIFSPRLFASRVRMLNPLTYAMADPFVRKQYVKSLLSVAGAWGAISSLAAGMGADVSTDLNSADFGKIRIGDTRLDPAAGFQQYLVAASRLVSGRTTSSRTGSESELGQGYRAETRKDVGERFLANKLHPVLKFAYDLAFASQYQPFHVGDRAIQMFVPLIVQDVIELTEQDPDMLALIGPVAIGMGTQTYGKGESTSKFISPENDWIFTGGAPENELSNLWEDQ